jgi:hypothetical protein
MAKNSQGPSRVPWGTPAGTWSQSEKQLSLSLTLCHLLRKKSITIKISVVLYIRHGKLYFAFLQTPVLPTPLLILLL